MSKFKNKTVLITGGASGIGKIISRLALERGANVLIWDINPKGIEETIVELSPKGNIEGYVVDVADYAQIEQTAQNILKEHGKIDILINNAGIVVGNYFNLHTKNHIEKTIAVNLLAPMYITQFFLPKMMETNSGHVCNIASMAGMIPNPKMSVYAASKWGIAGWSESVRLEMELQETAVKFTTVLPYYISTGMFAGVKSIIPILKPEKTAAKIVRAIEKNRIILGMPWRYTFVRLMQGVFPVRVFDLVVGKWMGIYHTMEHFTGRNKK